MTTSRTTTGQPLQFDPLTHCYVERETGIVIPAECLREYAIARLESAVQRLAAAAIHARAISLDVSPP